MENAEQPPSSTKKSLKEFEKALKRAERERIRTTRQHEQEEEKKKKLDERTAKLKAKQQKKDEEERVKEERRLKRLDEQRQREEEKENERKRKEEEKRKKEEERLQKELEKKKEEDFKTKREEKQRAVLLGFLVKGEAKKEVLSSTSTSCGPFMQFELRKDMRMAPLHRVSETLLRNKRKHLDDLLSDWASGPQDSTAFSLGLTKFGRTDYLHELKTKQVRPLSYPSTWPIEPPDIELLNDGLSSTLNSPTLKFHGSRGPGGTVWLRAKLFQFVENYRPAYYGTWRRCSRVVKGRRPFARDERHLDYSVDSDDEWEEEEPGESITQSENEEEDDKEEEEEEEEEDDYQFFVPHGYLSDDEGVAGEEAAEDIDDGNEEMKKLRRRLSVAEYEVAHRRGLQRLKPLVTGPVWLANPLEMSVPSNEFVENKENVENFKEIKEIMDKSELQNALFVYRVYLWDETVPIAVRMDIAVTPISRRPKRELPEEAVPFLIHLVHRSALGKPKLAFEFRVFWHQRTTGTLPDCTQYAEYKRQNATIQRSSLQRAGPSTQVPAWDNLSLSQTLVLSKIAEIAVFDEGRWSVNPEVIRRFKSRLEAVPGFSELSHFSHDADDSCLLSVTFPPWQFLTDVCKKPNRSSTAKRRSDISAVPGTIASVSQAAEPTVVETYPQSMSNAQLRVVLQPITAQLCLAISQNQPQPPSLASQATTDNPTKIEKAAAVSTTPSSRKRGTLDTFFSPPIKRRPPENQNASTLPEVIILDSD